jgi:molecular chaperone GrpE
MSPRKRKAVVEEVQAPEAVEALENLEPQADLEEEVIEAPWRESQVDLEELHRELEAAQGKADEYLSGWQRVQADFTNYKRRMERDQAQLIQNALGNAISRYLEVADDLDRALKNRPQEGDGAAWAEGVDLVYRKLLNAFEADGVKKIEAEGQFFDPNLHEAITYEDSPAHQTGQVIGVVQSGYILGERVLRPAKVRVAR